MTHTATTTTPRQTTATTTGTPPKRRRQRAAKPYAPTGPKTLTGSERARQQVAVVLEVLTGLRGPQDGADALGVTLSRYYAIETRGLQGMLAALEPRPRGRTKTPERELEELRRDHARLGREVERSHAVLRALERTVGVRKGLPAPSASGRSIGGRHGTKTGTGKGKGKATIRRTRRRTVVRAERAIAALRHGATATTSTTSPPATAAESSS